MKKRNKGYFAYICLLIFGYLLCTLPPVAATLCYFPLFRTAGGGAAIAGGTLILLALSLRPIWRRAVRLFRSDATALPWLLLFVLFFALSRIANEMVVISFIGFISNAAGALCLRLASRIRRRENGK